MERVVLGRIDRLGRPAEKYEEELGFWRWLVKTPEGRKKIGGAFEEVFGRWQRQRLLELGERLGLESEAALDAWCEGQSVVEIGAGPYPAVAAAPAWRRAVAVDPLASGYAREGLLPEACDRVTYIEAPGEAVPLASGCADLVIIENALDHVADPEAVVAECRRLLRSGGLLWVLVDLSEHRDHMHPHPFSESRIRGLLTSGGFEMMHDRVSDHKSHPKAYGEYRGLLKKPAAQLRVDVSAAITRTSHPEGVTAAPHSVHTGDVPTG
ncbi:MAG: class I SAM-dependent methyltransferase [Phycisphaerales bacterium]|nr:class I SAM-dependent methyltransferase [Phycisphaerales bacterium]